MRTNNNNNKGEYYSNVSILISEWANAGDFLDYLRKNYKNFKVKQWRCIFFQFLSVLAIIQSKYPNFRHNDLKANNILVHKISKTNNSFTYKVVGKTYIVPNIGYIVNKKVHWIRFSNEYGEEEIKPFLNE